MKHKRARRGALCLLLTAAMALSACGLSTDDPEPSDARPAGQPGSLPGSELGVMGAADDVFSLNYNSAASLNPYATMDSKNLLVTQLVCDNVFELDDDYNLTSRIITSWSVSAEGTWWTLKVNTDVDMHDGTKLTAADVAYSIQLARSSERYSGRFATMYGVSSSGGDTVNISTSKADLQLLYLLTVPVVKYGSLGSARPVASGPYMYVEGEDYLQAFDGYAGQGALPVERVYLKEYTETEEIITAFEDSYIDLVVNDPSGKSNLGYGGNTEKRYFTTTNMHYLGFNMESEFINSQPNRYALQLAVDRQYAADTLMNGGAVAAALPISPRSPLYDSSLARDLAYDMDECLEILNNTGVQDYDNDGKLEYVELSMMKEIELDLIVCSESAGKGDIAKKFADDLAEVGVTVNVRELSWNDYIYALQTKDFDIYYAEVKLPANFDLTRLLTQDAALNYGGIDDENYATYINSFLGAGDTGRAQTCRDMLSYISMNAPIIPVCFERQEVITHRNAITGINPTSGNVFFGITGWTVNFGTEEEN